MFGLPAFLNACTSKAPSFSRLFLKRYSTAITGRKKFYKSVSTSVDEDSYEVNLDGRKLKSPSGEIVKLPSDVLANAVALEWDSQRDVLKYHTMPITNLCFYAIDKPNGDQKSTLVNSCMNFLDTDTILFHSNEPPGIEDYQLREWGRIIDWVRERYCVELSHTKTFAPPMIPEETKIVFERMLSSHNFWSLTGFERLVHTLKSLLLSVALIERHLTVEEAVSLSRLEEEFQISEWGNVEWYHDIELLNSRAKAAACVMFIHACSEDSRCISIRHTG